MKLPSVHQRGFTLIELSLVLLVLGLLTRTLIEPLAGFRDAQDRKAVVMQLNAIHDSLLAHVVAYGALPCPVSTAAVLMPVARTDNSDTCKTGFGGIPAHVLGMSGFTDAHGQLLDPWNRPYRYAVSLQSHGDSGVQEFPDWLTAAEASRVGIRDLSADLTVCSQSQQSRCSRKMMRADNVVFVVLSDGKDDSSAGTQSENQDDDRIFLLQDESILPATRYDDHLVWSTAPDVMYWMIRSGWLP